jgi:hypothetical protein
MLAIIIASAIMGKPNLTTCPKNRKHYSYPLLSLSSLLNKRFAFNFKGLIFSAFIGG